MCTVDNLPSWGDMGAEPMFLMYRICKEYHRLLLHQQWQADPDTLHKGRGFPLYVLLEKGKPVQRDQKEIADLLNIAPSTLTGSLKRLEQSGLISKHEDPHDLRRKLIGLTDKGLAFMKCRVDLHHELQRRLLSDLSKEEQNQLQEQLRCINCRMQKLMQEQSNTEMED